MQLKFSEFFEMSHGFGQISIPTPPNLLILKMKSLDFMQPHGFGQSAYRPTGGQPSWFWIEAKKNPGDATSYPGIKKTTTITKKKRL